MSIENSLERIAEVLERLESRPILGNNSMEPVFDSIDKSPTIEIEPAPKKKERKKRAPNKKKTLDEAIAEALPEKEVVSTVDATPSAVTMDDLLGSMRKNVAKFNDPEWLKGLLGDYEAKKVSELREEDYVNFYTDLEAKNDE